MEFHPIANCWPMMSDGELDDLAADIKAHGIIHPIVRYEGKILDGRNRWVAAERAGITITGWENYHGKDPIGFAVACNNKRRHQTAAKREMAAARLAKLPKGTNQHGSIETPSRSGAAALLNVSVAGVKRAKAVQEHGVPDLVAAVENNVVSVSTAAAVATLPKEQQQAAVAGGKKALQEAAKGVRAAKRALSGAAKASHEKAKAVQEEKREPLAEVIAEAAPVAAEIDVFKPDPVSDCIFAVQGAVEKAILCNLPPDVSASLFETLRALLGKLEKRSERFNQEAA